MSAYLALRELKDIFSLGHMLEFAVLSRDIMVCVVVQMETGQLYLTDTYLFEEEAEVVGHGHDERGRSYIILNQTIFYPQGGGQPCDHGTIRNDSSLISIVEVRGSPRGEILHYSNSDIPEISPGSVVRCIIDEKRRMMNARYHTAGHLVSSIVEEVVPHLKATKCHAFPGEAYVEFPQGSEEPNADVVQSKLLAILKTGAETKIFDISAEDFEKTFYKLPYDIPGRETFRVLQIGQYPPVPCGGTHIGNVSEIGDITIKVNSRKGTIKVSYSLN
jgi:alanyl-tRNA synthetase